MIRTNGAILLGYAAGRVAICMLICSASPRKHASTVCQEIMLGETGFEFASLFANDEGVYIET